MLMATASHGQETGLDSAGSNENPKPNKHTKFEQHVHRKKTVFNNALLLGS